MMQPTLLSSPIDILPQRLEADPSRVVLRPFNLGWQAEQLPGGRAVKLVDDILALSEAEVDREYCTVMHDFGARHWQIEEMFKARLEALQPAFELEWSAISTKRKLLIAAYFSHEYTYAAAALMNPSIVPHPDQSGINSGSTRFVMSVRAVGEGHISSIAFREGFVRAAGDLELWPQADFAIAGDPFATDGDRVTIRRSNSAAISDMVLFPVTAQQQGGLEDLRLVRFEHEDGSSEFIGTYTAYSGSSIRSELLRTHDFRTFVLEPITGRAGRDKGMALFPRKIAGRYAMVGRSDGKNLYLLSSDELGRWDDDGTLLLEPRYAWELVQIGNCGSPIETSEGWLLLTHGVGAMRKYSLGCALLDLDDPAKVIARTPQPLLMAEREDRNGYVPNVVYSCGAMMTSDDVLFVPYGISDSAIGFGRIALSDLLDSME